MIHFMVDWENVQHNGLQGSQYLCKTDSITIFYSGACNRIEQGDLQNLLHSGCELQICKLVRSGKNALDFYISSRIGALFGSGYEGHVAIVSRDKGFQAVQDYWAHCVKPQRKIVISPSLETCIAAVNEPSERRKHIQRSLQVVNLETEFQKYHEKQYVHRERRASVSRYSLSGANGADYRADAVQGRTKSSDVFAGLEAVWQKRRVGDLS